MTKGIGTLLILTLILAACTCVEQPSPMTSITPSAVATEPCTFDYPMEWRYLVGSQVQEVNDAELRAEATTFVQGLIRPNATVYHEETDIYVVRHPDNPDVILVEYDLPGGVHHTVSTRLLQRVDEDWSELTVPPYPTMGFYRAEDADLMGYTWECDGWSLYLGVRNSQFYSSLDQPQDTVFYRSRDDGESWMPSKTVNGLPPYKLAYGVPWHPLESPGVSPPEGAVLATAFYDQEREQLTRFAWTEDARTLYAFSYSFIPTPEPP